MADVELMRRAGAKMANTMFNLAQHAGSVIDSDLAAKFDKMRKEWDAAVSAPSPASTAGERQSIDTLKFRALLSDVCAAYNSGTNVVMREQALIAHIDTWAGRSAGKNMVVAKQPEIDAKTAETRMDSGFDGGGQVARSAGDAVQEALERAAKLADAERAEFIAKAGDNNGRESDFAFGSVNSAERIAAAIRKLCTTPAAAPVQEGGQMGKVDAAKAGHLEALAKKYYGKPIAGGQDSANEGAGGE